METYDNRNKSFIQLHIAVGLFGFIAILGDLIDLSSVMITWWRLVLSMVTLILLLPFFSNFLKAKNIRRHLSIGAVLGLQWLTYFGTVKLANASVAVVCISTGALMTSFLEPMLLRKPIRRYQVWISLAIVPAMFLITLDMPNQMLLGIGVGLISAFLAALFSVLNKKYIVESPVSHAAFWQFMGGLSIISSGILIYLLLGNELTFWPKLSEWKFLIILAVLCTCLGYFLFLSALKGVSAYMANLIVNLEPLYGIVLGSIILKDYSELNVFFYIGACLIILTLFLPTLVRKYRTEINQDPNTDSSKK